MDEMRRTKTLARAEKMLRTVTWEENGSGLEDADSIETVIGEVEKALGVSIGPHKEATLLERGGLREKVIPPPIPEPSRPNGGMPGQVSNGIEGMQAQVRHEPPTAAPMARPPSDQALSGQPVMQQNQMSLNQFAGQQDSAQPSSMNVPDETAMGELSSMDNIDDLGDDMLMDDMDLDVGDTNIDFDDVGNEGQPAEHTDWRSGNQTAATGSLAQPQATNEATSNQGTAPQNSNPSNESELFANTDGTFDDFEAGDGLIDFEGGGGDDVGLDLGMDNSAFGDAFDATEPRE